MNPLTFASVPIGGHFVDKHRQLHQKTSRRCARAGSGPVYRHNLNSLAFVVAGSTTCLLRSAGWAQTLEG